MKSVSLTSTATSVELKSMEMDKLRDELTTELEHNNLQTNLESMTDDELHMKISKRPFQTMLSVQRFRHRPLEVVVEVDYGKALQSSDVIRTQKPSGNSDSWMFSPWIWVFIIFGGVLISALTFLSEQIDRAFGSIQQQFKPLQIVLIITAGAVAIIVIGIVGIPWIIQYRNQNFHQFDQRVLDIVTDKIKKLNQDITEQPVVRCWSCFQQVQSNERICSNCGKEQD